MKSLRNFHLTFIAAGTLFVTQAAFAHAKLLKSSPSSGEIVHSPPKEVLLHFSEDLELTMSKVEVKNSRTGEVVTSGALSQVEKDKASLKAGLKQLKKEKAVFEISWKAVAKDAHKMPGHISFTYDPKD